MNQGLTEDLAALKAYDPDEIEEKLRKIREIRAAEEREELVRRVAWLLNMFMQQQSLSATMSIIQAQQNMNGWRL